MNYLPFVILAYFLNGIAVTIDKMLLNKLIPNPLTYIFYISLLSSFALLALPLTQIPNYQVFILTSASTAIWTTGVYFMLWAVKFGQISRVLPVIGTLTPLTQLILANQAKTITTAEALAVGILILGLIFVTLENWLGKITRIELFFEVLASLSFAISYIFLKEAFLQGDFLTVLVWGRWILVPVCIILGLSMLGKKFSIPRVPLLFFLGQLTGTISQLLLLFSIFLASPVLVSSLQGVQYVFILILALIFSKKFPKIYKENTEPIFWISKIIGIILIGLGLYFLAN